MLTQLYIKDGKLTETGEGEALVWVYTAPDEAERRYLVDHIKLDEHTLNSALDPDELSRLEFEPDHAAIIFKRPKTLHRRGQFPVPGRLHGRLSVQGPPHHRAGRRGAAVRGQALHQNPVRAGRVPQADLPGDLPFRRAPAGHQHDLQRARAADQHRHGEQVPAQPVHPGKEPRLLPQRHQLERRAHRETA